MTGEIIPPGEVLPAESTDLGHLDFDWRPSEGLSPMERQIAWSRSFNTVYRAGVVAIVTAGRILIETKAEMPHGEWAEWIEGSLPVSQRTAQTLMRIAADPNILRYAANTNHGFAFAPLPQDRAILAELCGMEPDTFDALVSARTIHPEMKRGAVRAALTARTHDTAPPPLEELPPGKWRAILADPPWAFETRGGGNDRAPENHYPTMSLTAIELLPIMQIAADDAVLFLWVTSDRIKDAPRIMVQWGFDLVSTAFVWVKDGPAGLGYWTRKGAEICLLGKRGSPKRLSGGVEEVIVAPRGPHSRKPPEIGAGELYIKLEGEDDERYLGDAASAALAITTEETTVFSGSGPVAQELERVTRTVARQYNLTVRDVSPENQALFIVGDVADDGAATAVTDEEFRVRVKRSYQLGVTAANPAGRTKVSAVTVAGGTLADDGTFSVAAGNAAWAEGTDYDIDADVGRVYIYETDKTKVDNAAIQVDYTPAVQKRVTSKSASQRGSFRYIEQPAGGGKARHHYAPVCNIAPSGESALLDGRNAEQQIALAIGVLEPGGDRKALTIDGEAA